MVHPIAEANETSPFGSVTASEFYARHSVSHSSEYITNSGGLKLFTQSWIPLPPTKILGTLCVLHGFKEDTSWILQLTCVHFAKSGFATCAIDYQGHGNSQDLLLRDHIPDINTVVDDCTAFFDSFRFKYPESLPCFLYGESLGGAIALLIHFNTTSSSKRAWNGLVLHGAMCRISDKFKPIWPLEHLSSIVAKWVPTWRVVPTGSLPHVSFKEEWKRKLALACPNRKKHGSGLPTAATGNELLRVCELVQMKFSDVVAPILIVHGGGDVVCDPSCVEELYERAPSKDKTIRVYEGAWHLLVGESKETVELVFGEIVQWLQQRAERGVDAT